MFGIYKCSRPRSWRFTHLEHGVGEKSQHLAIERGKWLIHKDIQGEYKFYPLHGSADPSQSAAKVGLICFIVVTAVIGQWDHSIAVGIVSMWCWVGEVQTHQHHSGSNVVYCAQ